MKDHPLKLMTFIHVRTQSRAELNFRKVCVRRMQWFQYFYIVLCKKTLQILVKQQNGKTCIHTPWIKFIATFILLRWWIRNNLLYDFFYHFKSNFRGTDLSLSHFSLIHLLFAFVRKDCTDIYSICKYSNVVMVHKCCYKPGRYLYTVHVHTFINIQTAG